jgi:hypothetical protein
MRWACAAEAKKALLLNAVSKINIRMGSLRVMVLFPFYFWLIND